MPLDFYRQARALFPYLPEQLVRTYADAWATTGSPDLALQTLRENRPIYDTYFPGNLRSDGTVRLPELEFLSTVEGYRRRVAQFNIPPESLLTPERVRRLIEGEKSAEEFGDELNALYVGVVARGDEVRSFYQQNYGAGELSDAAIFASAIDQDASPMEFERRIRVSQVGGEARRFGVDLGLADVERLQSFGLDDLGARRLFAQATQDLPRLNELIERFNDPEDELTAAEFADALVLQSPRELQTVSRLLSRSRAQFTPEGETVARSRSGALIGLREL